MPDCGTTTLIDVDRVQRIRPLWWAAIAGAASAGALIFEESRALGAVLLGGAMLALAYSRTPCCASCAGASPVVASPNPSPLGAGATAGNGINIADLFALQHYTLTGTCPS